VSTSSIMGGSLGCNSACSTNTSLGGAGATPWRPLGGPDCPSAGTPTRKGDVEQGVGPTLANHCCCCCCCCPTCHLRAAAVATAAAAAAVAGTHSSVLWPGHRHQSAAAGQPFEDTYSYGGYQQALMAAAAAAAVAAATAANAAPPRSKAEATFICCHEPHDGAAHHQLPDQCCHYTCLQHHSCCCSHCHTCCRGSCLGLSHPNLPQSRWRNAQTQLPVWAALPPCSSAPPAHAADAGP